MQNYTKLYKTGFCFTIREKRTHAKYFQEIIIFFFGFSDLVRGSIPMPFALWMHRHQGLYH